MKKNEKNPYRPTHNFAPTAIRNKLLITDNLL